MMPKTLAIAALFCCLAVTFVTAQGIKVGDPAPSFDLPGVDGNNHALKDYADAKVLVVVFTCNHCPTAQVYEPDMKKFVTEYADKGVRMLAISSNSPEGLRPDELRFAELGDGFDDMKVHAKRQGFNFPYLYDGDTQEVAKAYGAKATPHFFVFDAERKLRYHGGFTDKEDPSEATQQHLKNAVNALLEGKDVTIKTSKPWGCSTKWKSKAPAVAKYHEKWKARPVTLNDVTLAQIKEIRKNDSGKLRLVNLWATWCAPCVAEFPDLVHVAQVYEKRPFEMITISTDRYHRKDRALEFLKKQHASVTNYIVTDADNESLAAALDDKWPGPIPYTILIAPGGEIVYRHTGVIDKAELRLKIIEQLGRYWDQKKKK
jgi:peroxiredoxin